MALPYPIAASQTDAKSPVDDNLMDSIRLDLDYLDSISGGGSAATSGLVFNINGNLNGLRGFKSAIDTSMVSGPFVPSALSYALKDAGSSGSLIFQILKKANTAVLPIVSTFSRYKTNIQSIDRANAAVNVSAIQRVQATQNTQSITYAYAAVAVTSVVKLNATETRYNLSAAPNANYKKGDSILFAGLTDAANNGTFPITVIEQSDYPSIVVSNPSGVGASGESGTGNLMAFAYNLPNPVTFTDVTKNINFTMAGHTDSANNGNFNPYAVNVGGNNVVVKSPFGGPYGSLQGGVGGTVQTNVFRYSLDPFVTADIQDGDKVQFSGCTSSSNNGEFVPLNWNGPSGFVDVFNGSGAAQAAPAGSMDFFLWNYAVDIDPVGVITSAYFVRARNTTISDNAGVFKVRQVDNTPSDIVQVYNEDGLTQASAAGELICTTRLLEFEADQSAVAKVGSLIEIDGHEISQINSDIYKYPYEVLAVNVNGQFNAEIETHNPDFPENINDLGVPSGMVSQIFYAVTPAITHEAEQIGDSNKRYEKFNTTSLFTGEAINNLDIVMMFIKQSTLFEGRDISVVLK